jgi:hypothetical protein
MAFEDDPHKIPRLDRIIDRLSKDASAAESFNKVVQTIFNTCVCQDNAKDNGHNVQIAQEYFNYMKGHRTCYSLVAQTQHIAERLRTNKPNACLVINPNNVDILAKDLKLIAPSVEQPQYNLFERQKMEVDYLSIFRNIGMGTTIWSPLASGLLSGKYNNGIPEGSRLSIEGFEWLKDRTLSEERFARVTALTKIAQELQTSVATLSIAWCLCNPNVSTAILGATKEAQLIENLKALDVYATLTPEILEQIENCMQTKPIAPSF